VSRQRDAMIAVGAAKLELLDLPGDSDAPALVLLHHGLGSVGQWRGLPERLAQATGRRTVAFSRHGHGRSDPPPHPRTTTFLDEEAQDLLPQLLGALEIDRPLLIGHSDGATIALIHAADHAVAGVVAIAPHVFVEPMAIDGIGQTKRAYESGELRRRLARHHNDPDAAFYGWADVWLEPAFRGWNIVDQMSQIKSPLLLIQGERDEYGTMAQLDAIERAATVPVQRVHLDCGHSPPTEKPDETVRAIARWLSPDP
jgi:pimeloyl-ACP methyl ester carboxylesterase